ncbi:hypothetical protein EC957_003765 [Mortierella hygrophila]|uniref:Uncharacterized protein n=1 Tax=Mortierella hygrophila TaxID=979708 RepID=A0A9P6F2Y2_9FUNG|nr:hypothetical protein EC957_003765 [Mortierella hygrophila]
MTHALRIAAALALLACAAQAVPIIQGASFPGSSVADADFGGGMYGMYGGIGGGDPSAYCDPSVNPSCYQNVHSGNVDVGSVVNAVPITQVTPVTQYQPVVQALAPIVDSAYDCGCLFGGGSGVYGGGSGLYGGSGLGGGLYGGSTLEDNEMYDGSDGSMLGFGFGLNFGQGRMMRRSDLKAAGFEGLGGTPMDASTVLNVRGPAVPAGEVMSSSGGDFGFNAFPGPQSVPQGGSTGPQGGSMNPQGDLQPGGPQFGSQGGSQFDIQGDSQDPAQCAPNDIACQLSIPSQTVDMGSSTFINPSTSVSPSTTYQPLVQSLESDIFATSAQDNILPQQSVGLGSNVFIQPTTSVNPETVYQPSVLQFATDVQAVPQDDQSLPQSSIQLGSTVQIIPTVHVRPITTFQNMVKSLPVIIQVEPCNDVEYFGGGNTLYGAGASVGQFSNYGAGAGAGGLHGTASGAGLYGSTGGLYDSTGSSGLYGSPSLYGSAIQGGSSIYGNLQGVSSIYSGGLGSGSGDQGWM